MDFSRDLLADAGRSNRSYRSNPFGWLGCLMMFVWFINVYYVIMFSSLHCCWLDVCIYVCCMPGLPLPEGDHCRLLVPGFDMANHDPRSNNDSPVTFPPDVDIFGPTG